MPKKKNLQTKKGPKGKKARRAAKLDRQWGEEANEEEIQNAKFRKGKRRLQVNDESNSRIKLKKIMRREDDYEEEDGIMIGTDNGSGDDYDDDNSVNSSDVSSVDYENDEFHKEQFSFSTLMEKIGKRKIIHNDDLNSGRQSAQDLSWESDDENNEALDSSDEESEEVEDDYLEGGEDDSEKIVLDPIGQNPYYVHFNRDPLPENALETSTQSLKMKKVKTGQLNDNLVLQISDQALKRTEYEEDEAEKMSLKSFSHVRKLLLSNWKKLNKKSCMKNIDADNVSIQKKNGTFSSLQSALYGPISNYSDALITCSTRENLDAINNIVVLHALNHVISSNHDITSHNNRIRELKSKEGEDIDPDEEWRDQGYTRPKVLILLPTRSTAFSFVQTMLKLIGTESSIENIDRFEGEFGNFDKNDETDERVKKILEAKGEDWNQLFADHINSDDDFKVGISFAAKKAKKKKSSDEGLAMKIYSDFYHSDIIIASPLGLKMAVTTDDEEDDDADFLSSIEMIFALRTDVMLMQNWDHVVNLMDRMNQQPKKTNRTDFSRVRNYFLLGQAACWRQLGMVSQFSDPHLISTFNRHAKSIAGKMKLRRKIPEDTASICDVMIKVRQVFQRVPCDSFVTQGDKRIKYFTTVVLPQLLRTEQKHTLLYIPSYFDFVALRNIFLKHEIASSHFVSITEYSRGTEVTRGRARFMQGRKRFMLYTGRAHFFMRHNIKGAKHLIMLGLPEHAEFYPELLNMLSWRPSNNVEEEYQLDVTAPSSCLNLFTKYEAHNLERIVGTKHSDRMIKGEKNSFLFQS